MNDDITPSQLEVVSKLYPRIQYLIGKGLTDKQVTDTLVVGEGWPIGGVQEAMKRVKRLGPNNSRSI